MIVTESRTQDHETAASAVRNLNSVDVGGRPLRIDLADSDPFLEGKTTVRGELIDGGGPDLRPQWREHDDYSRGLMVLRSQDSPSNPNAFLASLPPGVPVALGSTSLDTISQTLATMNPNQLMEVLAQTKAFVITHPDQARALLVAHPQLAYALFQALLLNKIVDPAILQRMLAATSLASSASAPAPLQHPQPQLQHSYHQPPPLQQPQPVLPPPSMPPIPSGHPNMYQQHQQHQPPMQMPPQQSYYRPPPPPQQQAPPQQAPPQAAPELGIDPAQRAMLLQVLSLTPDQINALPPSERDAIQQLRTQFMGGITV